MHRPFKGLILGDKKIQKPPTMGPAIGGWGEGVNFGLLNFHDSSLVGGGLSSFLELSSLMDWILYTLWFLKPSL